MTGRARDDILEWAEQRHIAPGEVRAALDACHALPVTRDWRRFLDRLLLWSGAVFLAAAVIFFFAYNWNALGRLGKVALAEAAVIVALLFVARLGLERASGRAALLAAALVTGALFAVIGQTWQTGADTFELFATWAVAILPWAMLGRFAALWILWMAIVHLALGFWFSTFGNWLGIPFVHERQTWIHLVFNSAALALWEWRAAAGVAWLGQRWAGRLLATAGGAFASALAMFDVFDREFGLGLGQLGWLAWLALTWFVYRYRIRDLFVLAMAVLSTIVVTATLLSRLMRFEHAGTFLVIGLIVIAMSALGGWWLRRVAREMEA